MNRPQPPTKPMCTCHSISFKIIWRVTKTEITHAVQQGRYKVSTVISIAVLRSMGLPQSADTTREDTPLMVIYSPVTETKQDQQAVYSYRTQNF